MTRHAQNINACLREAGYKLTAPRKRVADWINDHEGIFSAFEILKELTDIDTVTVYRTLELFSALDLIHQVTSLHGEQHYEIHSEKNHHHHIVCKVCERNECLPCDIPQKKSASFEDIHHSVIFTGRCKPCAS